MWTLFCAIYAVIHFQVLPPNFTAKWRFALAFQFRFQLAILKPSQTMGTGHILERA